MQISAFIRHKMLQQHKTQQQNPDIYKDAFRVSETSW
jgi:hypothetical protein